jgi:hypothetical protein
MVTTVKQIFEGWKNNIIPSKDLKDEIERVSNHRMSICNNCEHHSKNHKTLRVDAHCTNCGCTLSAKTKCLSCKCPIDKWKEVLSEKEEDEIRNEKSKH